MPRRRTLNHYHPVRTKNRFAAVLLHIPRYSGRYLGKLSKDTGLSRSKLRRIISGEQEPDQLSMLSIWQAMCHAMNRDLPLSEFIVPFTEPFPTKYPCDLFNCHCLPPWARDENDHLKPEFQNLRSGMWEHHVSGPNTAPNQS